MIKLVGIAGSSRSSSYNRALLQAAVERVPEGVTLVAESIDGVPLYDGDEEAEHGIPARVEQLKDLVVSSDGLLLVTPEYNHSIPGPFKNAFDWMTRPGKDIPRVFGGKPVGLIGATPGRGGTVRAQEAWLPVLKAVNARPFFGAAVELARAGDAFDDDRQLVDATAQQLLGKYLERFAAFCEQQRATKGS